MSAILTRLARLEARLAAAPTALPALSPVQLFERAVGPPDPWQAALLQSEAPRILINVSRQAGKSSTTAVLGLHTALYRAPALVLLCSPSLRQSQELFKKVLDAYQALGQPVPPEAVSSLRLELANRSRIVALPGSERTTRGFSAPRLVVLDEAARIDDALWHAVAPMVAVSGGRTILMSTPAGKRGVFFREWTEGVGWQRIEITAAQCPRISPEFLAQQRASLPAWVFEAEYMCQFGEVEGAVFAYDDIQAAVSDEVQPLWPN